MILKLDSSVNQGQDKSQIRRVNIKIKIIIILVLKLNSELTQVILE